MQDWVRRWFPWPFCLSLSSAQVLSSNATILCFNTPLSP